METTSRRRASTALTSAILAIGGLALSAVPAHADPTSCSVQEFSNWASSYCHAGTGGHRVIALCTSAFAGPYVRVGPWKPAGDWSNTTCDSGTWLADAGVETRA